MRESLLAKRSATLGGPDKEHTASSLGHGFQPWHPYSKVGWCKLDFGDIKPVQPTLGGLPFHTNVVATDESWKVNSHA